MAKTEKANVKVGDTVMVRIPSRGNRWSTGKEQAIKARVESLARVYATIVEIGVANPRGWRMRLDTQMEHYGPTTGGGSASCAHFFTLEQWEVKCAQDAAVSYLREQGIDLKWESPWRSREAELAALISKGGIQ